MALYSSYPYADLLSRYWQAYQGADRQATMFGFYYCFPDLQYFQDPQTGTLVDRPLASYMKDYLALHRQEWVLTRAHIAQGLELLPHRVEEGIYPSLFVATVQKQVLQLFEQASEPELGWLGLVPHNGAVDLPNSSLTLQRPSLTHPRSP